MTNASNDDGCWDVFGDDDDDSSQQTSESGDWSKACEEGALMLTQHFLHANGKIPLSKRRVASVHDDLWGTALQKRGIRQVEDDPCCWDATIVILKSIGETTRTSGDRSCLLRRGVVPGGILLCVDSSVQSCMKDLDPRVWDIAGVRALYSCPEFELVSILKYPCLVNDASCPWKPNRTTASIQQELEYLRQATVPRSASEILDVSISLTESAVQHAVVALQKHGYCVIKSLLHPDKCLEWGSAIKQDFDSAAKILLERDGVNLRAPQSSENNPTSYKEMAMREDLRVDLRAGPELQKLRAQESEHYAEWNLASENSEVTSLCSGPVVTTTSGGRESCLRFHSDVLEVIKRTMNPKQDELYRGNWGRYNFEGTGPNGSPAPLRVGPMGGILSLPGSADQAIHADTPHLFEHADCLPAHYINAFALGADINASMEKDKEGNFTGATPVGGTAFVHGSHRLSVAAEFNSDESELESTTSVAAGCREKMLSLLVRPSLQLGDVVLFDCRVLHFGLANTSDSVERPMLYVNVTHAWFNDPKNWDDRRRIFE